MLSILDVSDGPQIYISLALANAKQSTYESI